MSDMIFKEASPSRGRSTPSGGRSELPHTSIEPSKGWISLGLWDLRDEDHSDRVCYVTLLQRAVSVVIERVLFHQYSQARVMPVCFRAFICPDQEGNENEFFKSATVRKRAVACPSSGTRALRTLT